MRAVVFVAVMACAAALCVSVEGVSINRHSRRVNALAAANAVSMSGNGDSVEAKTIPAYVAPGPNDCRSPCPALNTLANHGLLPHDGKNINYDMLKQALIGVYGLGDAFGFVFAKAATKKFADPKTNTFSLCDLLINVHNNQQASGDSGIEHSASLSRTDRADFTHATDASQRSPSRDQVNIVLNASKDGKMITLRDMMIARGQLWDKSYKNTPYAKDDKLDTQQHIIADVEACLLLGALSGNSNEGKFQISKSYADSFLFEEKFPTGWTKSSRPLGIPQLLECLVGEGLAWASNEFTGVVELSKHWFGIN